MYYPNFKHVVILTGASISANANPLNLKEHKTYPPNGLANQTKLSAFVDAAQDLHAFYNQCRLDLKQIPFTKVHKHIQHMQKELHGSPTKLTIATLNDDDLHEKADINNVLHIYGELNKSLCAHCKFREECQSPLVIETTCPKCNKHNAMFPDLVWKGASPYHIDAIQSALSECDLFISIGTISNTFPTDHFLKIATEAKAHLVELNISPSHNASSFNDARYGELDKVVPFWIDNFLYDSFS